MPIILCGGGDAADVVPVDAHFAAIINREKPVLYIPVAMEPEVFTPDECYAWFTATYAPFGIDRVEMCTDLSRLDLDGRYGAVFIGGGNTYRLLDAVRRSDFAAQVRPYLAAGGVLYGGSAGAILCGKSIAPAAYLDENKTGLTDLSALDLLGGWDVWCHWEPSHNAVVAAYPGRLYVLGEKSGIAIDGETVTALGQPYWKKEG